jgi:hypothetical protein
MVGRIQEKAATLERLKIYGRDLDQSDPIFTKEVGPVWAR